MGRDDFPPPPETLFPASVDHLLTVTVELAGRNRTFTIDSTASVNLVTRDVVSDMRRAAKLEKQQRGKSSSVSSASPKGFGVRSTASSLRDAEEEQDVGEVRSIGAGVRTGVGPV